MAAARDLDVVQERFEFGVKAHGAIIATRRRPAPLTRGAGRGSRRAPSRDVQQDLMPARRPSPGDHEGPDELGVHYHVFAVSWR
jgi:hypothetical protein